MRERIVAVVESDFFQRFVIGLIVVNGVVLGASTYPGLDRQLGGALEAIDATILWFFVIELGLRLYAHGLRFFRDGWNLFDFVVVGISLVPAQQSFSVLRALRVLRVLRLVSALPQLRAVVQGLIRALPGIGSIIVVLLLVFYVFAVMAAKLYGGAYPDWFGNLGIALFSLFQIMTLEGWADMVREIMKTHPHAWIFFCLYIFVSTFTVLNLFIAVIVEGMQRDFKLEFEEEIATEHAIAEDINRMKTELGEIKALLDQRPAARREIASDQTAE